jgi:hypothetical protein
LGNNDQNIYLDSQNFVFSQPDLIPHPLDEINPNFDEEEAELDS